MSTSNTGGIASFQRELSQLVNKHLESGTPPYKIVDALDAQQSVAKVRGNTEGFYSNKHRSF